MSLSACPDCGANLGRNASKCRCGWCAPGTPQGPTEKPRVPCAADPACRYEGRIWHRKLTPRERVCVDHYSIAIDRDTTLAGCPTIPPAPIRTVQPKNVTGER
jgi:hypothetical protein